jgi:hypothetical protein
MVTMTQIKQANKDAGFFFFSRDTMNHFKSQVPRQMPIRAEFSDDIVFFITSEKYGENSPRRYHVRVFHPSTGDCCSGSGADFYDHDDARKAARHFAQGEFVSGYLHAVQAGPFQTFSFTEDWDTTNQAYVEYKNIEFDQIQLEQHVRG